MSSPRAVRALLGMLLLTALSLGLPGCGADSGHPQLVVSAAASLSEALPAFAKRAGFGDARFSFGGSDELAAQIRQGATPDVYAAASTTLPDELHAEGLLERPVTFATNRLVLAVPSEVQSVRSLADLTEPGVDIAVGDDDVPVGVYTREVLGRLPAAESRAILANVRSTEPDVLGITAKLSQGAVDAGFVYRSDVIASHGRLQAIELPASLHPEVTYGAGVVEGSKHRGAAARFVDALRSPQGQEALRAAGFLPAP